MGDSSNLSPRELFAAMGLFSFGQSSLGWVKDKSCLDAILAERATVAVKQADALIAALAKIQSKPHP